MKKDRRLMLAVLPLTIALAACSGQSGQQGSAAETTAAPAASEAASGAESEAASGAAESSVAAETESAAETETTAAEAETKAGAESAAADADAALTPIEYEITQYAREYPGLPGDDNMFIANTNGIALKSSGYEDLAKSLDAYSSEARAVVDSALEEQAHSFAEDELNDFLKEMLPFSREQWVSVTRADSKVFSFSATSSSWYGGAHPYSFTAGLNYDSSTGALLKLQDVTTDYDALYETVRAELQKKQDEGPLLFDEWETTLHDMFYGEEIPINSWNLTRTGLGLWFNTYELAPYAAGIIEVDLPYAEHKDLLKAEYFPEEIPEIPANPNAPYSQEFWIYDECSETGTYEMDGSTYTYSYKIPAISASGQETDYIKAINKELGELRASRIDPQLQMIKDGEIPAFDNAGYTCVTWNGITSICLSVDTPSEEKTWCVWNLHNDGTEATNEEILALFDMKPEDFVTKAHNVLAERVNWDFESVEEEMAKELKKMNEDTLSEANINASVPLFLTPQRGLGFIGGFYTPAGSGYLKDAFEVPDTEHRLDGLTQVQVNPMSADNYVRKGDTYEITDNGSGKTYVLDKDTLLAVGLPCYDDACDSLTWMERYLSHPAYVEEGQAADDPYRMQGIAGGDILWMLVDENNHVSLLQGIFHWD